MRLEADSFDAKEELTDSMIDLRAVRGSEKPHQTLKIRRVGRIISEGKECRAVDQLVRQVAWKLKPEEMHQRQVNRDEEGVVGGIDDLMR